MGTTQAIANHIDPTNSSQNGFPVSSNTLALCGDKKPQPMRPKNRRVRNACTNCRKACKKLCRDVRAKNEDHTKKKIETTEASVHQVKKAKILSVGQMPLSYVPNVGQMPLSYDPNVGQMPLSYDPNVHGLSTFPPRHLSEETNYRPFYVDQALPVAAAPGLQDTTRDAEFTSCAIPLNVFPTTFINPYLLY
ncbi:hypothetical protein B0H11DRAFT_1915265 [Mycena galericulata]|nr:hypothetical protein B0H11DRAFT_1915265 [Mycena galericulata]